MRGVINFTIEFKWTKVLFRGRSVRKEKYESSF